MICDENIGATVRKRRLLFFELLVERCEDNKLPKNALLGELEVSARSSGGQECDRLERLREDLTAFGIASSKKEWEASAKGAGEWYRSIEEAVQRFMNEWHERQRDAEETRPLERKGDTVEGKAAGKRGRTDGENKREEKQGGRRRLDPPTERGDLE